MSNNFGSFIIRIMCVCFREMCIECYTLRWLCQCASPFGSVFDLGSMLRNLYKNIDIFSEFYTAGTLQHLSNCVVCVFWSRFFICVRATLRIRVKTLGTGGHPLCERRYWFYIYGSSDCFVSFMIFFVLKNYRGIIQCEGTTVRPSLARSLYSCSFYATFEYNSWGVSEI